MLNATRYRAPSFPEVVLSFVHSMGWIALWGGCAVFVSLLTNTAIVDFIHINPNRDQSNAITIPVLIGPLFTLLLAIGLVFACSASLCAQCTLSWWLLRRFGAKALFWVVAATPVTALLTWSSYDYLIPSDMNFGFNEPADWVPYEHGLTVLRYFGTLLFQLAITLFCLFRLKFELEQRPLAAKRVLTGLFIFGALFGIAIGIYDTRSSEISVGRSTAASPEIKPVHYWKSAELQGRIQWSADSSRLLCKSSSEGRLVTLDRNAQWQGVLQLPVPFTMHWLIDATHVLLLGSTQTDILFYVVDLTTGKTVFEEHEPAGADPGGKAFYNFVISQDGAALAVGSAEHQHVRLYDTASWTRRPDIPISDAGVDVMSFSPSGKLIALRTGPKVTIADAHTGTIVSTIPITARWLSISHDDKLIAVEEMQGGGPSVSLRIYRIADGAEIAIHPLSTPNADCEISRCMSITTPQWTIHDQAVLFSSGGGILHIWTPFKLGSPDRTMTSTLLGEPLLSPDGSLIASSTGYWVSLFDAGGLEQ